MGSRQHGRAVWRSSPRTSIRLRKTDLYAMFIERALDSSSSRRLVAMITDAVMDVPVVVSRSCASRLSADARLRRWFILATGPSTLSAARLCRRQLSSQSADSRIRAARVLRSAVDGETKRRSADAPKAAVADSSDIGVFVRSAADLREVPGRADRILAHPTQCATLFVRAPRCGNLSQPRKGMTPADNDRFLRHVVRGLARRDRLRNVDREEAEAQRRRWFPYNKGGVPTVVRKLGVCRQLGG